MNTAIIAAGGIGKRLGCKGNKVFVPLRGKPLICWSVKAFEECSIVDNIVICAGNPVRHTAEHDIKEVKQILSVNNFKKVTNVVPGASTRMESIQNGLDAANLKENDFVLIHDGARPFVSPDLIEKLLAAAKEYGSAVCGTRPKDTIQFINGDEYIESILDRSRLLLVNTPCAARYRDIRDARERARKENYINKPGIEDASCLVKSGFKVRVIWCGSTNIKITTPDDLVTAEAIAGSLTA